jgi:hypothetical protein
MTDESKQSLSKANLADAIQQRFGCLGGVNDLVVPPRESPKETGHVVPPRTTAVPSEMADTEPTQRDRHLQCIAEKGRLGWQKMSGYNKRRRIEATIGRYKQVIGDGLCFRKDERRATEVSVAVHVMNRMLEFGRPLSIRVA